MTDPQSHPIDISAETEAPPGNLDLGPPPIDPPGGNYGGPSVGNYVEPSVNG